MRGERLQVFLDEALSRYRIDRDTPMPLFGRLVGGDEGVVWLGEPPVAGAWSRTYTVFAAEGGPVGRADFGRPVNVIDASVDQVLVVVRDEFDVQAIAMYRYRIGS
jgi:hypothetical protein